MFTHSTDMAVIGHIFKDHLHTWTEMKASSFKVSIDEQINKQNVEYYGVECVLKKDAD